MPETLLGSRRIHFDVLKHGLATMGSDVIAAMLLTPEYSRWVDDGLCFRLDEILSYDVGAAFGYGTNRLWCDCLFEFDGLDDETQALLVLRDDVRFNPDLTEWNSKFTTGCGWENR